jgi:hypothetical protein
MTCPLSCLAASTKPGGKKEYRNEKEKTKRRSWEWHHMSIIPAMQEV